MKVVYFILNFLTSMILMIVLPQDIMQVVFENGKLLKDFTFDEVRENAEICLVKNKKTDS